MLPQLIQNKIDWYRWRSLIKACSIEYHSIYGLGNNSRWNETHQRTERGASLFKKNGAKKEVLDLINWRGLDKKWTGTDIFALSDCRIIRNYQIPNNY